jgi:hypothetical protein
MSARYGGSDKRDDVDNGEDTQPKKKKRSNSNRDHCPPYDQDKNKAVKGVCEMNRDNIEMPIAAHDYYDFVGTCKCRDNGKECDHARMVRNKFTPWTRFPTTTDGKFLGDTFITWKNPYACRTPGDVQRECINKLVAETTSDGHTTMVLKFDKDEMNTNKWMKFWYSVHKLYEWAHNKENIDDATLQHYIRAYYNGVKDIYKEKGALQHYRNARLFEEESDDHRNLFRNFRDRQYEYFNLNDDEKDELMKYLLREKANVVKLFSKVYVLRGLEFKDRATGQPMIRRNDMAGMPDNGLETLAAAAEKLQKEEEDKRKQDEEDDALRDEDEEDNAQDEEDKRKQDEEHDALWNAISNITNGGSAGVSSGGQRVRMLLDRLQRLII